MKYLLLLAVVICFTNAQTCPKEGPFPETPAGEFAYAYCDEGEWGIRSKYCTSSSNPIWIEHEDICTPSKKLIHPPYGSNMVDYKMKIENFHVPFTPKHMYEIDYALYNITIEFVVKPKDVLVIDWEKDINKTLILSIHQRMDFVYRDFVIDGLVNWAKNGTMLERLIELNDDFLDCNIIISEDSFKWNSYNIFYNFYWDCLIVIAIISVVWYYLCKLGRKQCAKKEAAKAAKKEEKAPLVY